MFSAEQEANGAMLCGGRARRSHAMVRSLEGLDLNRLTIRALEVVLCAREGDSNDEIARYLGISVSTVKYYLAVVARQAAEAPMERYAA